MSTSSVSATPALWVPDRGDIIWIDFNPQAGVEMKDEHPMLVISGKIFNEKTSLVIGLAMTHSQQNEDNPFAVKYSHRGHTGYVLTHQPKSFDWRERKARPHHWGKLPANLFQDSLESLNQIMALC